MADLRARYQAQLGPRLTTLRTLAARLNGGEADRPIYIELLARLHKLAGSAGTFGLPELSRRCLQLEHRLAAWLALDLAQVDACMRGRLRQELVELLDAAK
ncbi:Hpt domain-containing protein [Chromobacterium alticapitis]|uniref:HPt domain-containing protein n=1 Tax=Chromobacterium alticapitis TaxID=2073169 RepID=A0A2S5DGP3_9NEIS|nr:Hpt domain-containing protein [Chromobacterium alticapitis]POZ62263.1 hypothetical protein C2I19_08830 [Chromobacterium alticapitis]